MSASKTLFWFCLFGVAGVGLASFSALPQILVWGFLFLGVAVILVSACINKKFGMIVGFCLLFCALGIARFGIAQSMTDDNALRQLNDRPEKITLTGTIIDGPDVRDSFQMLKVKTGQSIVLVSTAAHPDYHYLDTVHIVGKLKTPTVFDDFNYKNYLLKDGVYSVMDFPTIKIVSTSHQYTLLSWSYEKILWLKSRLKLSLHDNFSKNQALMMQGILLGDNKNMPQDLRDMLNAAGLRYLTAISGVHVIIMSDIIFILLLSLGLWRGQAFYGAVAGIGLYVVVTGMSASGVRAAIMASLFLFAQKIGRQNTGSRTIALAAAFMVFANPLVLRYDLGFQLSFLAALGIIYAKPFFGDIFASLKNIFKTEGPRKFFQKTSSIAIDLLSVTLAAQLFIFPVMVYNFGLVSLVAPVSSLLVLPVMPWLIGFGFLSALCGIFSKFLAWFFHVPAFILLSYFFAVISLFSKPWMTLVFSHVWWLWLAVYYVPLAVILFFWHKRKSERIFEW